MLNYLHHTHSLSRTPILSYANTISLSFVDNFTWISTISSSLTHKQSHSLYLSLSLGHNVKIRFYEGGKKAEHSRRVYHHHYHCQLLPTTAKACAFVCYGTSLYLSPPNVYNLSLFLLWNYSLSLSNVNARSLTHSLSIHLSLAHVFVPTELVSIFPSVREGGTYIPTYYYYFYCDNGYSNTLIHANIIILVDAVDVVVVASIHTTTTTKDTHI